MNYAILCAALSIGLAGACLAAPSGTSDREGGFGERAMEANHPNGPATTDPGRVRPCSQVGSGTSDRQGGQATASTISSGPMGGTLLGGC